MTIDLMIFTTDGEEINIDETVTDEQTTSELLVEMNDHLRNIESGINHIVVLGLLLIVWLGLCRVFGKWYFGGV